MIQMWIIDHCKQFIMNHLSSIDDENNEIEMGDAFRVLKAIANQLMRRNSSITLTKSVENIPKSISSSNLLQVPQQQQQTNSIGLSRSFSSSLAINSFTSGNQSNYLINQIT